LPEKILVCDDEPFILKALTFVVRKEGHTVLEAKNGEEALEVIRAERPRVVFLDLMMPKKTGYEVLEEVRKSPDLKDVYVILLTAKGQDSDRERGLALGANEFMTKPFSPAAIVTRLREILAGGGSPSPA
jgi:DNA-binding response OmpR family regulator